MSDEDLNTMIEESMSLCRGVVQRYLAYLQNIDPLMLFPGGVQRTNEIEFKNIKTDKIHALKFDIVDDKFYKFPIEECPGKAVSEMMAKMINQLHVVTKFVLEEIDIATVPRPELFHEARIAVTPFTSAFLYNVEYGREMHDNFSKRIAFVWT
jgi:hypothetical protein